MGLETIRRKIWWLKVLLPELGMKLQHRGSSTSLAPGLLFLLLRKRHGLGFLGNALRDVQIRHGTAVLTQYNFSRSWSRRNQSTVLSRLLYFLTESFKRPDLGWPLHLESLAQFTCHQEHIIATLRYSLAVFPFAGNLDALASSNVLVKDASHTMLGQCLDRRWGWLCQVLGLADRLEVYLGGLSF